MRMSPLSYVHLWTSFHHCNQSQTSREHPWKHSKPPLRIERWALKLQQYEYNIVYQHGDSNAAEYMSRHPTSGCDITGRKAKMEDEYVNFTVVNAVPKAITLGEVEQTTLKDNVLQNSCESDVRWTLKKNPEVCTHQTQIILQCAL